MRRRIGLPKRGPAEYQGSSGVYSARSQDAHPKIGDHVTEMQADRAAPDTPVEALEDLPRQRGLRFGKSRYRVVQLSGRKLRVQSKMRPKQRQQAGLEIRPLRPRRQRFAV